MIRLSRLTAGSSADDTGAEQQLRASLPQSIPRMPVHGRVGAHADTHARVVTFDSFLTSAAGEGGRVQVITPFCHADAKRCLPRMRNWAHPPMIQQVPPA